MRALTTLLVLIALSSAAFGQSSIKDQIAGDWQEDVMLSTHETLVLKPYVAPTEILPVEPARLTIAKDGTSTFTNWRWCLNEATDTKVEGKTTVEESYGIFLNMTLNGYGCTPKFRVVNVSEAELKLEIIK